MLSGDLRSGFFFVLFFEPPNDFLHIKHFHEASWILNYRLYEQVRLQDFQRDCQDPHII